MTSAVAHIDFTWTTGNPPGGGGSEIFTPDTSSADWGPAIIPGAPIADPIGGIITFGTGNPGVAPPAPSPHDPPRFLGIVNGFGVGGGDPIGVAVCSGPAPTFDGTDWVVDPQTLTVLRYGIFGIGDAMSSWVPLAIGTYYYFAVEQYGALTGASIQYYSNAVLSITQPEPNYLGVDEAIVPVGATVELADTIMCAAGPVTIDVDWGDGTVDHLIFDHSGEGDILDDGFFDIPFFFTGPLPSHVYTSVALREITCTCADAAGGTAVVVAPVAVVGPLVATLTVTPRVPLPGNVVVAVGGHSDAWDLMESGTSTTNPDGYDPTQSGIFCNPINPHTAWRLRLIVGDGETPDALYPALWNGPGDPGNLGPSPANPEPPTAIRFVKDPTNLALSHAGTPAVVELTLLDCFRTWQQQVTVTANVILRGGYERSFPRDDGNGMSSQRSFPPPVNSIRSYPTIP